MPSEFEQGMQVGFGEVREVLQAALSKLNALLADVDAASSRAALSPNPPGEPAGRRAAIKDGIRGINDILTRVSAAEHPTPAAP